MNTFTLTCYTYPSTIGPITIASNGRAITHVALMDRKYDGTYTPTKLTNTASNQIQEYLAGKRSVFDLPIEVEGTPFQLKVWEALQNIPYGQTRTYAEIAAIIGSPRAFRAVGTANNRNPLALIIPCHRVIGANDQLVGYAWGLKLKKHLLELERANA